MFAPRAVVVGVLLILGLCSSAFAQITTGDIVGRVTDNSGGVLPGATVTVENVGTRVTRSSTTSASGDYLVTLLPLGEYIVRIELEGFQRQEARVAVRSGERVRVDGKLPLGSLNETVQVTAEAPLLQTDSSTISTLVTESEVQDLPVNGRNFVRLVQLVPGANEGGANSLGSGNRPDDRRQTSSVSINGAGDNQNNILIDGMDNNERAIGTIVVRPSMDALAEVRVQTNNYPAEVGRTAGGVINLLTKSGTNTFRGSVYGFFRDDRFDERDYFATSDPVLKQKQFGGSLGGPLVSNRTFFFVDYEGLRQRRGQVNLMTVPTAKMRGGDFSEITQQIYDPLTRQPFAGNLIPANRIDPIAARYMALFPLPTTSGLASNYSSTTLRTQNSTTADLRIDHRLTDKGALWARYSLNDSHTVTPPRCPAVDGINGNCLSGTNNDFPGPNDTDASALQVNYVRVFNTSTVGEFKGGYGKIGIFSYPSNYQTNASQKFGLTGVNVDELASGLALMNITGYAVLGDTQNIPLITKDFTQQYAASITRTSGAHSMKVGGGLIWRNFSVQQSAQPNGLWAFNNQLTAQVLPNNTFNANSGHAVASFLLGFPSTVARSHTPFEPHYYIYEPSLFIQDDWRATSNLTINLGLRYDLFSPFHEEENRLSNLDLQGGKVLVAGKDGVSNTAGVNSDSRNFGPRAGFAWTISDSIVLRGGYGLTYFPGNIASFAYMKNAPLFSSYNVTSGGTTPGLQPDVFLRDGLPVGQVPSIVPSQLSGTFRAVDVNFRSTRVNQFNLQFEKEFLGNVVSVGYVGSRGDFLAANPDINQAPLGAGAIQPRRRFAGTFPQLAAINVYRSVYESWYDAMQLQLQRRLRSGLSFNTHYRLARAEQTSSTPWDALLVERVATAGDNRHTWVGQVNYEVPFGQSLKGVAHGFVAGWQVNAIANFQTGSPFGVTNQTARGNTGGGDRPNLVGDPELPNDQRTVDRWFNTAAFVAQPQFTLGNSPAIVMHGPSQRRLDLSFFKDFDLVGTSRLQFRYEIYNVTNVANFQNPVSALGSPDFGRITSTGNSTPRQMQFAVRYFF
jgi:hypothetical protein